MVSVQNLLNEFYSDIRQVALDLLCQTVLYGIYLCLVPIVVYVMCTNGLQSRARKLLLAAIICTFALSTMYWTFSVVQTFHLLDLDGSSVRACISSDNAPVCLVKMLTSDNSPVVTWQQVLQGILFANVSIVQGTSFYLIVDGIIVWRAWVLCSDQSRVVLMIPVVMLAIDTVIYLIMVALRAVRITLENKDGPLTRLILVGKLVIGTQLTHLTLSLLINISATSIIALRAWKYRKLLMETGVGVQTPSQAFRVLAILTESGGIYILIGGAVLASVAIPLATQKASVFSDLITTLAMELVGIYQVVVLLLVEKNRSLNSTFYLYSLGTNIDSSGSRLPQMEPIRFSPGQTLTSGGQTNTGIHVAFESTSDGGTGAGSIKILSDKRTVS